MHTEGSAWRGVNIDFSLTGWQKYNEEIAQ